MKLVQKDVAQWVAEKLEIDIHPPYISFALEDDFFTLRGGVIFNDWNGANIEITLYCPGAYRRELQAQIFRYVFNDLGCIRLTARTRGNNKTMQKMLERIGFEREAIMEDYFGRGDDAHLYRLKRGAVERWLK